MQRNRPVMEALEGEYRRYQQLGEAAMAQLSDADLIQPGSGGTNSIAIIVWHLAGNFRSRFTDFLTSDGEKPWRHRDEEFESRSASRDEILRRWHEGWRAVLDAIAPLDDADLDRQVTIRSQPLSVREAVMRSLAHASYHVGQIVLIARMIKGDGWRFLSIPPGQSEQYNRAPTLERPPARR